ncbi:MAG: DNA polymerase IV [Lachnospiraceae bacterium]|nr:DNA polymerase IV [Lachnospiraceae bacterium]
MDRVILHSDMNCFYASVEMLYHPELAGRPLAVGGDPEKRHGIVLTANYPAKKKGIKVGMALWQAKQACPDVVFVPPRMDLYLRFSRLARELYSEYTDLQEPFGIDECWLDVTDSVPLFGGGRKIAEEIRRRIKLELGLTVSVGVSWNKIFAKFGSDFRKPDAVTEITRENYRDLVWRAPAADLLYVGRSTRKKLATLGMLTIGDVARSDPELLHSIFGKMGYILWVFANGEDRTPVSPESYVNPIKSIGNGTTSPRDLEDNDDVRTVIYLLSESVASRLRDNHFVGDTVGLWVRDNGLYSFCRQQKIGTPTNISDEIARHSMCLFEEHYPWTVPIRSIGVRMSGLHPDEYCYQLDLFSDVKAREKQFKIDLAVDSLRSRFGHDSVLRGRMYFDRVLSGLDAKAEDHMIHPHSYFESGDRTGTCRIMENLQTYE